MQHPHTLARIGSLPCGIRRRILLCASDRTVVAARESDRNSAADSVAARESAVLRSALAVHAVLRMASRRQCDATAASALSLASTARITRRHCMRAYC